MEKQQWNDEKLNLIIKEILKTIEPYAPEIYCFGITQLKDNSYIIEFELTNFNELAETKNAVIVSIKRKFFFTNNLETICKYKVVYQTCNRV